MRSRVFSRYGAFAVLALLAGLSSCGGGDSGNTASPMASSTSYMAGVFQPSAQFIAQCQNPRTGSDPITGKAYPDVQGTTLNENNWLRSWTNELYLWYSEVPDMDPGTYSTTADYFNVLKTSALTSTGAPKDKFHFTEVTSVYEQSSQAGIDIGYGLTFDIIAPRPPRLTYVAMVAPDGPAATAGLTRGLEVLAIDGVDAVNAGDQASVDTLNAGLSPSKAGEQHTFTLQDPTSGTTQTVTLLAAQLTENPVPVVSAVSTNNGTVGYLLFNDFIATSEQGLINAINQLKAAGVTELVLDIRYNGGGYLDIASELAYMIGGPPTAGKTFQQITFNDKNKTTNPVTNQPLTPTLFHTTTQGFSVAVGTNLPYLGLQRVFVITGPGTCSASEAVMNGLKGVGIEVDQIGTTTCGKPYGFYPADNCGTTYFSIQFQGENAMQFADYSDGFSPQNSSVLTSAVLPGCSVADDFTHALGDPAEGRFAAALGYLANKSCPTPPAAGLAPSVAAAAAPALSVHKARWRENMIMRH